MLSLDLLNLVPGPQDDDVLDTDAAGQVRRVRRRDDLDSADRAVRVVLDGRFRLLAEVVEQDRLQLRVEVGFGFFDQEERQLGLAGVLELQDDGGDEQQVGVAQARFGQIGRLDAVLGHLEPQAAAQLTQVVRLEAELDVLAAYRVGQRRDVLLDAPLNTCSRIGEDLVVSQLADRRVGIRQELVAIFRAGQLLDDEGKAAAVRGVEFALGVSERRQVDVADLLPFLRFRVGTGVPPCMKGQLRAFRDRLVGTEPDRVERVLRVEIQRRYVVSLLDYGQASQLKAQLDRLIRSPMREIVGLEVTRTAQVERSGGEPECIDDVRLAGVVLAYQEGERRLERNGRLIARTEVGKTQRTQVHPWQIAGFGARCFG